MWQLVSLAVLVLVLVGGAGAAGACKLFLDCGIGSKSLENEIVHYQGKPTSLKGLPANLAVTTVARGFTYPTDFDFLPGGKILMAEKNGLVRSVSAGGSRIRSRFSTFAHG